MENQKSLKRGAACLDVSVSAMWSALKNSEMKFYISKIVHQLKPTDIADRCELAQTILDKIKVSGFVKLVSFFWQSNASL